MGYKCTECQWKAIMVEKPIVKCPTCGAKTIKIKKGR